MTARPTRSNILVRGDGTNIPMDRSHTNGWDFTDGAMMSVTLYGPACDAVMAGTVMNVSIVFICVVPRPVGRASGQTARSWRRVGCAQQNQGSVRGAARPTGAGGACRRGGRCRRRWRPGGGCGANVSAAAGARLGGGFDQRRDVGLQLIHARIGVSPRVRERLRIQRAQVRGDVGAGEQQ
jgi:hypothetical protein